MNNLSHSLTKSAAANSTDDQWAESFWLKEAKAQLRARDPVDAAQDAEALAHWADLHCGDILQTSIDALQDTVGQGGHND